MVVSPVLRGMFGLSVDPKTGTVTFAPHAPTSWTHFSIKNVRARAAQMDLTYSRDNRGITLEVNCAAGTTCPLEFKPSISLSAEVLGAGLNGKPTPFHVEANGEDKHAVVRVDVSGKSSTIKLRIRNNFNGSYDSNLPGLGSTSEGLRLLSTKWTANHDSVTMEFAGAAGAEYELAVEPGQLATVEGAEPLYAESGVRAVRLRFAAGDPGTYARKTVVFHISEKPDKRK